MAGAADGVTYLYKNVGIQPGQAATQNGVTYLYKNVGVGPRFAPIIGRVIAYSDGRYGVTYVYKNVT